MSSERESWQNFIKWISDRSSCFAFRGISNKEHLLISSVGRKDKIDKYSFEKEMFLFNTFKLKTNLLVNSNNDLELLTIAQHYALPTRLLDWTENPLVACFFAIQNKEFDGRIYAFNYKNALNINLNDNPFHIQDISVIFPPITSNRINLQRGLFTIHPNPDKPCLITPLNMGNSYHNSKLIEMDDAYNFIENLDSEHYNNLPQRTDESFEKYQERYYSHLNDIIFDIKKEHKPYFENRIRQLGIDETIFGDIESISKKALYECNNGLYVTNDKNIENYSKIRNIVKNKLRADINSFREINTLNTKVRNNIEVWIDSIEKNCYNMVGRLELHPNYFFENKREFLELTPEKAQKIKKVNKIFSNLMNQAHKDYYFYHQTYQTIKFNLKYYFQAKYLGKLDFDTDFDFTFDSKDITITYTMYKMLFDSLSDKENEIINSFNP